MANLSDELLEHSCESFSRKVLRRLVDSGAISDKQLEAAETTVRFNDTILTHPLGGDVPTVWDIMALDLVLRKVQAFFHLWECKRACLGCTCRQGRNAFTESQEVLVALFTPLIEDDDEDNDDTFHVRSNNRSFELMWHNPRKSIEFHTIRHVTPKYATHVISDARGIVCFSSITSCGADVCAGAVRDSIRPERLMKFPGSFGGAACCVAGRTLVCGGCDDDGVPSDRTRIIEGTGARAAWRMAQGLLQIPRFHHSCVTLNGDVYVVGGCSQLGTVLSSFEVYNLVEDKWSLIPDEMNQPRAFCGCAVIGQTIFVFGGLGPNDELLTSYECWTKGSGRGWITLGDCPSGGASSAAGSRFVNNDPGRNTAVYVAFTEQATLWIYYPQDGYWIDFDHPCGDNRKIQSLCFAPEVGSFMDVRASAVNGSDSSDDWPSL